MKKGMLIGALVGVLVLTGCGSKQSKLVCTSKESEMGMEVNSTATAYFNSKGYVTKIDLEMTVDAGDKATAKELVGEMKSSYDSVKQDGKKVIVKTTEKPGKDDKNITRKDAKKELEEEGYKCK